jgi:hypothetical protein
LDESLKQVYSLRFVTWCAIPARSVGSSGLSERSNSDCIPRHGNASVRHGRDRDHYGRDDDRGRGDRSRHRRRGSPAIRRRATPTPGCLTGGLLVRYQWGTRRVLVGYLGVPGGTEYIYFVQRPDIMVLNLRYRDLDDHEGGTDQSAGRFSPLGPRGIKCAL